MDRDPSENVVDAEDRSTPTTGQSPYGEAGSERAREAEKRNRERGPHGDTAEREIAGQRSEPGAAEPSSKLPG
ncbi:MAG: hypothetical protein ABW203_05565 [Novosphingobium sp.]